MRTRKTGLKNVSAISAALLALACGEDKTDFDDPASGGSAGSVAGASGSPAAGSSGSSGSSGAGGASSGAGGSAAASGSAGSSAGSAQAGTAQGGGPGVAGSGAGQTAGGAAGSAAGASGSGGMLEPTLGCGAATYPESDQTYTIDVDGVTREYIVSLPASYDPNTPYKLVFAWHGRTGTAEQIAGRAFGGAFYGLKADERGGDSTIFVAGQGLGTDEDPEDTGWPNTDGRDVAFVRAMLEWLSDSYCIDPQRIFSIGMSYGGIMSNTLGCEMGDTFRAIAPIASAYFNFGGGSDCVGPVATWLTHGTADDVLPIENGEEARDLWLAQNHCDTTTTPVEPSPCVQYEGCDDGYPVHWCVHDEGHIVPDFSADAAWSFFSKF